MIKEKNNKLFPAQAESEKVLSVIRKHWFTYLIFWIIALLMILPVIIVAIYWALNPSSISEIVGNIIIVCGSMYALFICGLLIYGFIDFYLDVYILTDHRIVDITQNGFFKRKISELNLRQIQDVNAQVQGLAATLLHFGNVHIQTAGEQPNFVFESIPHPYATSKKILDLHEAYLRKREQENENSIESELESVLSHQSMLEKSIADENAKKLDKKRSEAILSGIEKTKQENAIKKEKEGELIEGKEIDLTDFEH